MTLLLLLKYKFFDIGGIVKHIQAGGKKPKREEVAPALEENSREIVAKTEEFHEKTEKIEKIREQITQPSISDEQLEHLAAEYRKLMEARLSLARVIIEMEEEEHLLMLLLHED